MTLRRILGVGLALSVCACTRAAPTPTAPSQISTLPPPTVAAIAGVWTGPGRWLYLGEPRQVLIRAELRQADAVVTGDWRVVDSPFDNHGVVSGRLTGVGLDTIFEGTVTWEGETASRTARCIGVANFRGAANRTLGWSSPQGWDYGDTCVNAIREVQWTLGRE